MPTSRKAPMTLAGQALLPKQKTLQEHRRDGTGPYALHRPSAMSNGRDTKVMSVRG